MENASDEVQLQLIFELDPEACQIDQPQSPLPPPTVPQTHFHTAQAATPHARSQTFPEILRNLEITNAGNMLILVDAVGLNGKLWYSFSFSFSFSNKTYSNAHGFSAHNCSDHFELEPGQSKILSVSFRPDFSSSFVQCELFVYTSQGLATIPLVAKFSLDQLILCSEKQVGTHQSFHLILISLSQRTENHELLRFVVLLVLAAIFLFLCMLTFKEYYSSPQSQIPDVYADHNFAGFNQPLPKLPDLEPLPSLEEMENISKLTYLSLDFYFLLFYF